MNPLPPYHFAFGWSEADREHVATCREIPGLSGLGGTREAALVELKVAIAGWLDYLAAEGHPIPPVAIVINLEARQESAIDVCSDVGRLRRAIRWADDEWRMAIDVCSDVGRLRPLARCGTDNETTTIAQPPAANAS